MFTASRSSIYNSALAAFLIAISCAAEVSASTLFERLGGIEKVTAAANDIVDAVAKDPRTHRSFEGVALAPLKKMVAQHLCSITDGPCIYQGETMAVAHQGLAITSEEFDVMGNYVDAAFLRQGASRRDREELEHLLEAMRSSVLQK